MTAKGELYIDEDCRDYFADELDEVFGKGKWHLYGGDFGDFWDMANFPEEVEVSIIDDETWEWELGKAIITSRFYIEDGCGERYIEIEPDSIVIDKYNTPKRRKDD